MTLGNSLKQVCSSIALFGFVVACDSPTSPRDTGESSDAAPLSGLFAFTFAVVDDHKAAPLAHQITTAAGEIRLAGPFGCPNAGCTVGGHASVSGPQSTDPGFVTVYLAASEGGSLERAEPYRYTGRVRAKLPGPYRVQLWLRPFFAQPAFLARDTLVHVK